MKWGIITWYYKDFLVQFLTGDLNKPECIASIEIFKRSDKFKTYRGIKVGDSEECIYRKYRFWYKREENPKTFLVSIVGLFIIESYWIQFCTEHKK